MDRTHEIIAALKCFNRVVHRRHCNVKCPYHMEKRNTCGPFLMKEAAKAMERLLSLIAFQAEVNERQDVQYSLDRETIRDLKWKVEKLNERLARCKRKIAGEKGEDDMKFILVRCDDWEALYANDQLAAEGHEIDGETILSVIQEFWGQGDTFDCDILHVRQAWAEEGGFPEEFAKIPESAFVKDEE